jgi:hypothetical protein
MDGPIDHQPVAAAPPAKAGPVDNKDVEEWKNRFNHVLGNAGEVVNSKASADAGDWSSGFFGCCNPIDTCMFDAEIVNWRLTIHSRLDHLLLPLRHLWQDSPSLQEERKP